MGKTDPWNPTSKCPAKGGGFGEEPKKKWPNEAVRKHESMVRKKERTSLGKSGVTVSKAEEMTTDSNKSRCRFGN